MPFYLVGFVLKWETQPESVKNPESTQMTESPQMTESQHMYTKISPRIQLIPSNSSHVTT